MCKQTTVTPAKAGAQGVKALAKFFTSLGPGLRRGDSAFARRQRLLTMTTNDNPQRQQALDLSRSVIVQAPAGSGKTELLCRRYLRALSQVQHPSQVLAITFTRKAADEMRERLLRYCENFTNAPDEARLAMEQNQRQGWNILGHPQQLSIMTIDSLCAQIVQQSPLSSGIFGYQISDTPQTLYEAATLALLEDADQAHPWQEALHALLLHFNNQWPKVQQLLINMLSKREQWLMLLPELSDPTQWRTRLEKNLHACFQEAVDEVNNEMPSHLKENLVDLMHFAHEQQLLHPHWKDRAWPTPDIHNEMQWRELTNALLTQKGELRKTVDKRSGFPTGEGEQKDYFKAQKQRMLEALAKFSENEILVNALQRLSITPHIRYDDTQWESVVNILTVLRALLAYWQVTMDKYQAIDFTEVALKALTLLGEHDAPSDLALHLDYRLQHILVDEFQDTSLLQYHLLSKLTAQWQKDDGHSLFLVGDPLQSIYRFRQAEVGLFLRIWQHGFNQLHLEPILLHQNFRAQEALVKFFNENLSRVLPSQSNAQESAIAYAALTPTKPPAGDAIYTDLENKNDDVIITQIQTLQEKNPASSIAILVRSRNHLLSILPRLQAAGIPYQARDLSSLAAQPVIIDLLSWLNALLQLEDRLAWLSVLNSPWLGISLNTLQAFFADDAELIWERLLSDVAWMERSAIQDKALAKFLAIWKPALELRQTKPLDQILSKLWEASGAADYWNDAASAQATRQFFILLQHYQMAGDLIDKKLFEQHLAKQAFNQETQNASLHIMTIHKAKGLEFDFVFLPSLEKPSKQDEYPLLAFDEVMLKSGAQFILAPLRKIGEENDRIFNYVWQLQKKKSEHERLRLLYVACTRAKQAIYFYANTSLEEDFTPKQGSLLADLWLIFGNPLKH